MSSLDSLTAKIVQDARDRAAEILRGADASAERLEESAVSAANEKKEQICAQAEADALRVREQIVNGATLALRDRKLKAKQETIDRVFATARERLEAMDEATFLRFLERNLLEASIAGTEEVVLPARFSGADLDAINKKRVENGKRGELRRYEGDMSVDHGFVLLKEGAVIRFTYDALIAFYRDELEREIIQCLFDGR